MIKNQPFYAKGLSFSCTRCSACCRYETGYVFLSEIDVSALAAEFKLTVDQFIKTHCRWIPSVNNTERLSLKEKADLDCVFWNSGCKVYNSRPLQCRAFPFWLSVVSSEGAWKAAAESCPGMNQGKLYSLREIEAWLEQQKSEPAITRRRRGL
jgi:Fe-S-cluster containining protein